MQTRHSRIIVDLEAIRANYSFLRSTAPDSKVIAVVKADAYGHGAIEVARALPDADAFAVATTQEAIQLRQAGIAGRILVLGGVVDAEELLECFEHRLDPVFHQFQQIEWLEQVDPSMGIDAWLKLNSGMGRLGFNVQEFLRALEILEQMDVVHHLRLMTHLANADDAGDETSQRQLDVVNGLGLDHYEWSIANSAGILNWPDSRRRWVRAGIALYGSDPMLQPAWQQRLQPAMTFKSIVLAINHLKQGDRIGYGGLYICPGDRTIAVVAAGYNDGYPRHVVDGQALVAGQLVPLVGRVSMDMITLDVTGLDIRLGDEVTLWGESPLAIEIASNSETIAYELYCHAGCQGQREYLNA